MPTLNIYLSLRLCSQATYCSAYHPVLLPAPSHIVRGRVAVLPPGGNGPAQRAVSIWHTDLECLPYEQACPARVAVGEDGQGQHTAWGCSSRGELAGSQWATATCFADVLSSAVGVGSTAYHQQGPRELGPAWRDALKDRDARIADLSRPNQRRRSHAGHVAAEQ